MVLACQEEQREHRRVLQEKWKGRIFKFYVTLKCSHQLALVVMRSHLRIVVLLEELSFLQKMVKGH